MVTIVTKLSEAQSAPNGVQSCPNGTQSDATDGQSGLSGAQIWYQ